MWGRPDAVATSAYHAVLLRLICTEVHPVWNFDMTYLLMTIDSANSAVYWVDKNYTNSMNRLHKLTEQQRLSRQETRRFATTVLVLRTRRLIFWSFALARWTTGWGQRRTETWIRRGERLRGTRCGRIVTDVYTYVDSLPCSRRGCWDGRRCHLSGLIRTSTCFGTFLWRLLTSELVFFPRTRAKWCSD